MDIPKIDIDDVIATKLTANQIRSAFLTAYGKYPCHKIAEICQVSHKTITNWEKNNEYYKLLVRHIRKIELYRNLEEYTELKKASIASLGVLMQRGSEGDIKLLKEAVKGLNKLLNVFD